MRGCSPGSIDGYTHAVNDVVQGARHTGVLGDPAIGGERDRVEEPPGAQVVLDLLEGSSHSRTTSAISGREFLVVAVA
jgi:hypothetical protein